MKKKWLFIVGGVIGLYIIYTLITGYFEGRTYSLIIKRGEHLISQYEGKIVEGRLNKEQKDQLKSELNNLIQEIEAAKKEGNKPNNEQFNSIEQIKEKIDDLAAYSWHDFPVANVKVKGAIEGPLAGLIDIQNKTIEVKSKDGSGAWMTVDVKSKPEVSDGTVDKFDRYYITAQFFNAEDEAIVSAGIQSSFLDENNKIINLLKSKNGVGKIEIGGTSKDKYNPEMHEKQIAYVRFSSEAKKDEVTLSESSEGDENEDSFEVSNTDFDEVLDNYEDYVDEYIKFVKKAADGDMSAMSQYPALLEKANKLDSRLTKSKGDMTAKQVDRMINIQLKMTKAAMEISKKK